MGVKNPDPMHPGVALETIYLVDLNLSQSDLAKKLGCAPRKVNEICRGKRGISAGFAIDLERVLGTTAEMWVNMQAAWDLHQARVKKAA